MSSSSCYSCYVRLHTHPALGAASGAAQACLGGSKSKPATPQDPEAKEEQERGHVTNGAWIQASSPAPVQADAASQASPGADRSFLCTRLALSPPQGKTGALVLPSSLQHHRRQGVGQEQRPPALAAPESHAAHGPATSLISPHPPTFPVPFSQHQPHSLPLSFKCTRHVQPRLGDTVLAVPSRVDALPKMSMWLVFLPKASPKYHLGSPS